MLLGFLVRVGKQYFGGHNLSPLLVWAELTELKMQGRLATHPAHPLVASLILGLVLHADMVQITDLHLFYIRDTYYL